MAPADTLFNATIVLVPIWLGVARYLVSDSEFESANVANVIGLGMISVLFGILYSMWESITQLATIAPNLTTGLVTLFGTISLMGIGGILFVIREIDHISGRIVTGTPSLIAFVIIVVLLVDTIFRLKVDSPVLFILQIIMLLLVFAGVLLMGYILVEESKIWMRIRRIRREK